MEDDKVESSQELTKPALKCIYEETPAKIPLKQHEEVREKEQKGKGIHGRVHRQSTKRHIHDTETIELDLGWSSDESFDQEGR